MTNLDQLRGLCPDLDIPMGAMSGWRKIMQHRVGEREGWGSIRILCMKQVNIYEIMNVRTF